jgi:hypothetical protein
MYFHRARHYDPAMNRFVQEDPIGQAGGENLYAYVGGAPLEATDPAGMRAEHVEKFGGLCLAHSCVGWDGSVSPGGYMDRGGLSDSYLNQTRAAWELKVEILRQYRDYESNYLALEALAKQGVLPDVWSHLYLSGGRKLKKGEWNTLANAVRHTFAVRAAEPLALDRVRGHLASGRIAVNDLWIQTYSNSAKAGLWVPMATDPSGSGATSISAGLFSAGWSQDRLSNAIYHETLHSLLGFGECQAYAEADRASGFNALALSGVACSGTGGR